MKDGQSKRGTDEATRPELSSLARYGKFLRQSGAGSGDYTRDRHQVLGALREQGVPHRQVPEMLVLRMKDPFIRDLRKLFGKTASVEGMRLGGQSFGDRFIEDGYVYRIN